MTFRPDGLLVPAEMATMLDHIADDIRGTFPEWTIKDGAGLRDAAALIRALASDCEEAASLLWLLADACPFGADLKPGETCTEWCTRMQGKPHPGCAGCRARKLVERIRGVPASGWTPWRPSMHSTGLCVCGAQPAFKSGDQLRCRRCVPVALALESASSRAKRRGELAKAVERGALLASTMTPKDCIDAIVEGYDDPHTGERLYRKRNPDGTINNCALANGHPESDCGMCLNACPDRSRFK